MYLYGDLYPFGVQGVPREPMHETDGGGNHFPRFARRFPRCLLLVAAKTVHSGNRKLTPRRKCRIIKKNSEKVH